MRIDLGDCEIRQFAYEDADSLAHNADNPKIADQLRDRFPHPYTAAHARKWIEETLRVDPVSSFAVATRQDKVARISETIYCRPIRLTARTVRVRSSASSGRKPLIHDFAR